MANPYKNRPANAAALRRVYPESFVVPSLTYSMRSSNVFSESMPQRPSPLRRISARNSSFDNDNDALTLRDLDQRPTTPTMDMPPPSYPPSRWSTVSEFDITKAKKVDDFEEVVLQELEPVDVDQAPPAEARRKPRVAKMVAIVALIIALWIGWSIYAYYYWMITSWQAPRVWMNTNPEAAFAIMCILGVLTAVVTAVLLKLIMVSKTNPTPRLREVRGWGGPLVISVVLLVVLAFATSCITIAFAQAAECNGSTPYPIYVTGAPGGGSAVVYDGDTQNSTMVARFSLSQNPNAKNLLALARTDGSSATGPLVNYDLSSGVATIPSFNITANFPSGAVGPIDYPSVDTVLDLTDFSTTTPLKFGMFASNANGTDLDILFTTKRLSPISRRTLKLCAARVPGRTVAPILLTPLGLAMHYHSLNSA